MDLISYISVLLYLVTFIAGIRIGRVSRFNLKSNYANNIYIAWLYIFLCFGYMTGSDWRSYEMMFYGDNNISINVAEFGFWHTFEILSRLIPDYWIVVGMLKCIYLYSFIRLTKKITVQWPSLIAFSLPLSLMYLLIDNPLRFMMAMTFVNFAIPFLLNGKLMIFLLLSLCGVSFHSTSIIVIMLFLLSYYMTNRVLEIKPSILAMIYIIFSILLSSVTYLSEIQTTINQLSVLYGFKDYGSYTIEDNSSFFTIGSFLSIFYGLYIIANLTVVRQKFVWGDFIAKSALLYIFLQRATLLVPSGYRFLLPLSVFYALFFVVESHSDFFLLKKGSVLIRKAVIVLMTITLVRTLYQEYVYIPYSNSIPYIITEHLPFHERDNYNIVAAEKRLK